MIQKLMNKPLLLNSHFLEVVAKIEWLSAENAPNFSYNIYNGVAIIPIHGLLTKRKELFSPIFGSTSYEEISKALSEALDNPKVEKISARYHELQFAIGVVADCSVHDVQLLLLIVDSDVYADLVTILRDKMDIILRTEREYYGKDNDPSDIARSMAGAFDKVISNLDMITEVASHIRKES